jgi:hypothetical protein
VSPPYTLDIYDDVTNTRIETGIIVPTSPYRFPEKYTRNIGVYRVIATDSQGRSGEMTIAIRSGPVSRMEFFPVSSTLVK